MRTQQSLNVSTRLALCSWPNSRWARWPWETFGMAAAHAIPGIRSKDRAVLPLGPQVLSRPAAWALPLALRRWARSARPRRVAEQQACAHFRLCASHRRHGTQLDDGQAGAHRALRRGLRPGAAGNLRSRWERHLSRAGNFQLGWHRRLALVACWPFEKRIRSATAIEAGRTRCRRDFRQKERPRKRNTEQTGAHARRAYDQRYDLAALDKLRAMGIKLIPVQLPKLPYGAMTACSPRRPPQLLTT